MVTAHEFQTNLLPSLWPVAALQIVVNAEKVGHICETWPQRFSFAIVVGDLGTTTQLEGYLSFSAIDEGNIVVSPK